MGRRCEVFVVCVVLAALSGLSGACTQTTSYDAPSTAKATEFRTSLTWDMQSSGSVYMSTWLKIGKGAPEGYCASGYFGAQFLKDEDKNLVLFSMAHTKEKQIFPDGPYCQEDCFDCTGPKHDVQCKRFLKMEVGMRYDFVLQMTMQNASGAMWEVDMEETESGTAYEIGRMFFVDAPLGLPADECRQLGLSTYSFQEHFAAIKDFSSEATWAGSVFSGVMAPLEGSGYCKGEPIEQIKDGISLAACKQRCASSPSCKFASFSSEDNLYSDDGKHCMLFASCDEISDYLRDIWTTAEKQEVPEDVPAPGFCDAPAIAEFKVGVTAAQCQAHCLENSQCNYASYSSGDTSYSDDGTHCMLFSKCDTMSTYRADIWTTSRKAGASMVQVTTENTWGLTWPATDAEECCASFDWGKEKSVITSRSPLSMRFSAGPDVVNDCPQGGRRLEAAAALAWSVMSGVGARAAAACLAASAAAAPVGVAASVAAVLRHRRAPAGTMELHSTFEAEI